MKTLFLVLLCSFSVTMLFAQGIEVRSSVIGTKYWSSNNGTIQDASDVSYGIGIAGYVQNGSKDALFGVLNYNSQDTIIIADTGTVWDDEFHSVCYFYDYYSTCALYAGYTTPAGADKDIYLLEYDLDMSVTQTRTYNLPYDQELFDVIAPEGDQFFAIGYTETDTSAKDFFFVFGYGSAVFDTIGTVTQGGPGDDILYGCDLNPSASVIAVAGTTNSAPSTDLDMSLTIYSTYSHSFEYDTTYVLPGDQVLYSIVYDDYNYRYIATGYTTENGQKEILYVVFDEYGYGILDYQTFSFPGDAEGLGIEKTSGWAGPEFLICGYVTQPDMSKDMIVLKYKASDGYIGSHRIVGDPGMDEIACSAFPAECELFLYGEKNGIPCQYDLNKLDYSIDLGLNCPSSTGTIQVNSESGYTVDIEMIDSLTGSVVATSDFYEYASPGKHYINFSYTQGGAFKAPCIFTDSVIAISVQPLIVDYSYIRIDCDNNPGSISVFPISGNGGYAYAWSNGMYDSTIQADTVGLYFCTVTDNCGGTGTEIPIWVDKMAPGRIQGWTYADATMLTEGHGNALLMQLFGTGMDTLEIAPISSETFFEFDSLPDGQYIVKFVIDSTQLFPGFTHSYFCDTGAVYQWENADTITIGCDSIIFIDLLLYEMLPQTPGNGTISGHVWVYTGSKAVGEPVPGAEILVEQEPTDIPVQCVYTDQNGFYEANGLALGYTYRLTVDVPGYGLINTHQNLPISSADTLQDNMNFYVDTAGLEIMADTLMTGTLPFVAGNMTVSVFPIPVNDILTIEVSVALPGKIDADIIDIKGRIVATLCNDRIIDDKTTLIWNTEQSAGEGMYMLRIKNGNDFYFRKILINNN